MLGSAFHINVPSVVCWRKNLAEGLPPYFISSSFPPTGEVMMKTETW